MKTIGLLLIVAVVALGVDVCGVGIAKAQTSGRAMGTAPGAGASSEDLWQRAVALIDRNDYRDAIPLLQQAAKMGHAKAQATLGIAYQDGNGVRADDRAAAYWFGLAAAQGHRASEYALGGMYEEGEGGLPRRSVVVVSQIESVEKAILGERIGSLSAVRVEQILSGLRFLQRSYFQR
jgi:TPR repeat protein